MSVLDRHRVTTFGSSEHRPVVFGHGFATDQSMWRFLVPAFVGTHRVVMFDHLGHGEASRATVGDEGYTTLDRYAADVLDICTALDLRDLVFVGHSVGGIIGALAATADPDRFAGLVLIGSSPRFVDDVGYEGGYTEADIADLIDNMDSNLIGWSASAAPGLIGDPARKDLAFDLAHRLARTDQRIAWQFARATFLSDHRADIAKISVPALVLQCSADTVVPPSVGHYLARHIPNSRLEMITATGHFPNLSAPEEVTTALHAFLRALP